MRVTEQIIRQAILDIVERHKQNKVMAVQLYFLSVGLFGLAC
jgi:hypothetical protein